MDPKKFYGSKAKVCCIRDIPAESDDSEISTDEEEEELLQEVSDESSVSEQEDEDEVRQAIEPGPSAGSRKIVWRQKTTDTSTPELLFLGAQRECPAPREPLSYYQDLMSTDIMESIVLESNRYSIQKDIHRPLNLVLAELLQFIGIIFYMSIVKIPRARMYWSPGTRCSPVADTMPSKRFEEIKGKLHFSDNAENNGNDKLAKIRPFFYAFRRKINVLPKSEMLSIDEQIVPFKGRSSLKQYNAKKPKKWGLGPSSNIVLRLLQDVPRHVWHKLYIDNWFNSINLQTTLHKQGIACLGTVRANRLKGCEFPTDKEMSRKGRGTDVLKRAVVDGVELNAIKWLDRKAVVMLSSFGALEPRKEVTRFDKKQKKDILVQCPSVISLYNKFMGGVDLLDSLVALYRNPIRSKKWYMRIALHIFDLAVVQSWLIYVQDCKAAHIPKSAQHSLLEFKREISFCLLNSNPVGKKRGRLSLQVEAELAKKKKRGPTAPVPSLPVRTDNVGHFPLPVADKGRCKFLSKSR
ncbi:piggyBac transposable element-derived protein 3-like [Physella acuta]|uniref:piggyBac transposable element-derived protein 3-like n=1 Tax=Physella acuta TaxID=109671 RepID=UPI0027DC7FFC|nr:piggyBac transposable element-derived protein 3-like [Physella acuta]